jgi:hypothetical protein
MSSRGSRTARRSASRVGRRPPLPLTRRHDLRGRRSGWHLLTFVRAGHSPFTQDEKLRRGLFCTCPNDTLGASVLSFTFNSPAREPARPDSRAVQQSLLGCPFRERRVATSRTSVRQPRLVPETCHPAVGDDHERPRHGSKSPGAIVDHERERADREGRRGRRRMGRKNPKTFLVPSFPPCFSLICVDGRESRSVILGAVGVGGARLARLLLTRPRTTRSEY